MVSTGVDAIFPPGIYVSLAGSGTGSGNRPSNSMSYADFQAYALQAGDVVYFKEGDQF